MTAAGRRLALAAVTVAGVLRGAEAGAAQFLLTWTGASSTEAGFEVHRRAGTTGPFAVVATTGPGVTSHVDTGLVAGVTYCYRVRAVNAFGPSLFTNQACGVAPGGILVGAGAGARLRELTRAGAPAGLELMPYPPGFVGIVRVATGDVDGDGIRDVIAGAGPGGGAHVRVFAGPAAEVVLADFLAYDPGYVGGLFVAAGDVDGDGRADVVTGTGPGGGPHVQVFRWSPGGGVAVIRSFFAYDPGFTGGIAVAACDVDGDGSADIVTGAGPGGGPHVQVVSGATGERLASFFAYDPGFRGGVFVACGDLDGDGRGDIVTGVGAGGGPHVKAFRRNADGTVAELASFLAYAPAVTLGVRVGAADLDGDGLAEILTAPGPGGGPHVRAFAWDADGSVTEVASFFAGDPADASGVFISGGP